MGLSGDCMATTLAIRSANQFLTLLQPLDYYIMMLPFIDDANTLEAWYFNDPPVLFINMTGGVYHFSAGGRVLNRE